ncbi:hypothetical protein NDU88_006951 [Pleurodeles waltl]|uniref:Ig-like domain-containing protein n=2 Tax=Pleurodeles waltl TaxID=8319 RepID=A0AAV7PMW2_PLEWA|nr:hypothetical protein NDU88_006951 [Pleurodeles waltl]
MLRLLCVLLPLGTGIPVSGSVVRGVVGRPVTLHCTYPLTASADVTSMCWGRKHCPYSGCDTEILRTDGRKVTWSKSARYQMKGNIAEGDVSLTIEDVNFSDTATYCCRVEIPGWFNDKKREQTLEVDAGPNSPNVTFDTRVNVSMGPTVGYTHQIQVPVSDGTLSQGVTTQQPEESDSSVLTPVKTTLSSKTFVKDIQESLWKTNTTIYVVVPVLVLTLSVLVAGFYIRRLKTNKNPTCISSLPMRGFEPGGLVATKDVQSYAEDNFYIME